MRMETDKRLLRLAAEDNVLTAITTLAAGEEVWIEGERVRLDARVPLGFKVAARAIRQGEKVLKYGVPIGSATAEIRRGEVVHTHNLKSDYLPTYTWERQAEYFGQTH
ncbi:MAG: UxaA family hydrolase [Verrucomicrobiae bacterium]|nr:UxaA family hydrolase [Verrucomicrobiae bacterium]